MNLGLTIKRAIARIPGARRLKYRLFGWPPPPRPQVPVGSPANRGAAPAARARVAAAYAESVVTQAPDRFVLYRIIGNDLPPRHAVGQSRRNLAFILEHEPELADCEKRFVVNRIVDPDEERAILKLLNAAGAHYLHIPLGREEYRRAAQWDIEGVPAEYAPWTALFDELTEAQQGRVLMRLYRHKNNYVMNNNGARNAALRDGRARAKWVLPWDGNCFVTASAWEEITAAVRAAAERPYFIVPMARVTDHARLMEAGFRPDAVEEPQIIFRQDAALAFDPGYYYGRRPKVELLWRLGVPGSWDTWALEPWDLPCPPYAEEAGAFGYAGWVARLHSGQAHLEQEERENQTNATEPGNRTDVNSTVIAERGVARVRAIKALLDLLDGRTHRLPGRDEPIFTRSLTSGPPDLLRGPLADRLSAAADEALTRGPYSVVHKQSLPPSRNRHDYWHPAPYYWPHPSRLPWLAYVYRDGRRVPGTQLYEPLSEKYDRTRLQRLFDDTYVLTLAWQLHGDSRYAEHAATLVRTWFLEPATAMNPHLDYAQVRWGHNGNKGSNSGIIEMKDLYYFLDGVRLLQRGEWLSRDEQAGLQQWFERYLEWLRSSTQGRMERAALNNHGTYYDLQIASVAAFIGAPGLVRDTLRDSRSRMLQQFEADGTQPAEMARTNTAHYCCFNLQGWLGLAELARAWGEDLWSFEGSDGRGIRRAAQWLLSHAASETWPYPQMEPFDRDRFYPIYHLCREAYGDSLEVDTTPFPEAQQAKPVFFPHDGIRPFWQLGLTDARTARAPSAGAEALVSRTP